MSHRTRLQSRCGFTLIEMMIAVTLVSAILAGLLMAMRTGLTAYQRINQRLEENRRAMGLDQALHRQMGGMMPVSALCGGAKLAVFTGAVSWLRLVSSASLEEGTRGYPRVVEYYVDQDPHGGVRLMMNERVYTGPSSLTPFCAGQEFLPVTPSPQAFEMAGKLAYCRFSYRPLSPDQVTGADWVPAWVNANLPRALRVEMLPLNPSPTQLPVVTLNVPVHVTREVLGPYAEQ